VVQDGRGSKSHIKQKHEYLQKSCVKEREN
jgi:hypothetical protein